MILHSDLKCRISSGVLQISNVAPSLFSKDDKFSAPNLFVLS